MNNQKPQQSKKKKNRAARRKAAPKSNNAPARQVSAPVARGVVRQTGRPKIERSARNGDVTVEHREYIREVPGSVAFANSLIPVNPGLSETFPWLSQMAALYESYRFEKLQFEFETEAPTSSPGSLMMAVDYDASDAAAPSKVVLASYRRYIRSPSWAAAHNVSEKEDLSKRASYYVRGAALAPNQDVKLYDVGNLNLATQGQTDTAVIGELYVCYRVKLMTPQLNSTPPIPSSARYTYTTLGGAVAKFGSAPVNTTSPSSTTLVFTATAPYQGLLGWSGSAAADPTFVPTTTGGASVTANGDTFSAGAFTSLFTLNLPTGSSVTLTAGAPLTTGGTLFLGNYAFGI